MTSGKRVFLFGLLALTVFTSVWVSETPENESDGVVAPADERSSAVRKDAVNEPRGEARLALRLDKLQREPMAAGDLNPFGTKSWFVAPPAPPPPPPPKPTAPPLPFTFVGKLLEEGGRSIVYLAKGEESYAVSKGDTFDSVYRLEGIENGNLVIQYLPLETTQLLPIGGES